ncbi:alpha-L-fucosidase [Pedobacter rhizosphaerae]|uniref:alpha-L-fucosidase n=1 Tax=Pedobacter rhizosphaerae TaxID=390241 RepID=A0A1H9NX94_9SPHI|nr:alpha-L-fucosidase [Pedobacter rhizosphaerae]SER40285.1 alpha-L-fucosidase [Pedobacter rhizosphaerae]
MSFRKILTLLSLTLIYIQLSAQQSNKMQWFADAKLGIFIHWGVYSVDGISESWSFYNNYVNYPTYKKQLNGFTAAKYNPTEWVNLIKESGAKYAVITSKHHDGISLWDSKAPLALTVPKDSKAKKDVLTPFVTELKKSGLKTGIYFSLPDWSYPHYDIFTREHKRYDAKVDMAQWKKFLNYQQLQLKELANAYNPDLYWFDGDWEHSAEEWEVPQIKNILSGKNQNVIFNSRLGAYGDYETPEQGVPVLKPQAKYWELCYTMNDSWGYQPFDTHYKSANMIIRTLVDCISMGGNLLLDIGPKADGTIAPEQVDILKKLGRWTKKHTEAIYGTETGIPSIHFNGKTALSKDKKTLYLFTDYQSNDGLALNAIQSKIKSVSVIGYTGTVNYKITEANNYLINLPKAAYDQDVTVIKVTFAEPVQLSPAKDLAVSVDELLTNSKSSSHQKLASVITEISKGNNIFDKINLTVDGAGFEPSVKNLDTATYNWVLKHTEALSKTQAGIPEGHYQGKTFLSADKQNLFLIVESQPTGPIAIKGLKNKINRIRIVGEGTILPYETYNKLYWSKIPGIVYIPLPAERLDKHFTIINVLVDGPIDLYREHVGVLDQNN